MEKPKTRPLISACLVVHNEEKLIKRCLESLQGVVNEIILVHDGPCEDASLKIAGEFRALVFERPFIGEAEYHRPFAFEQATGEWVLQIDADEFLPLGSKEQITNLVEAISIDGYCLWWPYWDGKKYFDKGPLALEFKPCLFRREKLYMVGVTHEHPRTYGRLMNTREVQLCHQPMYNNFSWSVFRTKWLWWVKLRASQIKHLEEMPLFNVTDGVNNVALKYYRRLRRFPLVYAVVEPFKFLLIYLKRGLLISNLTTWRATFWLIIFRFYQNIVLL